MKLETLKLELIHRILATDDTALLEKILEIISQETMVFHEAQAPYKTKEEEPFDLATLSPEFQESIRIGLEQSDRGEGISDEEDQKYWEKWFKEN